MAKISLPYIAWRDGRPRFVPGARERKMGFKGQDLKHDDGRWFSLDEASGFAQAKLAEIHQQRATGKKLKTPAPARGRTVEQLWNAYIQSDAFLGNPAKKIKGLAESSQKSYKSFIKALHDQPIWQAPIASLDSVILRALFDHLHETRGLSPALSALAALGAALAWGRLHGWFPKINGQIMASPYWKLDLPKPDPRIRVASVTELMALVAAADHTFVKGVSLASIGDAIAIGFCSGQRKKDIIEFIETSGEAADRFTLRQSKTGAIVSVPRMPVLVERLARAKERRRTLGRKVEVLNLVINERTGKRYDGKQMQDDFQLVRATAINGIVDEAATAIAREQHARECRNTELPTVWILPPCKSLAEPGPHGFTFPDLRDSAVTWLARAECTIPEIASITGHTLGSIYEILKHYLQIDGTLADNAIRKLRARMEQEGLAL